MQNTPTRPTSTAPMNVFIPFSFQSGKSLVDYSLGVDVDALIAGICWT